MRVWSVEKKKGIFKMRGLLKFITCGSVDDGKSTLIGHMLYQGKLLFTDQEQKLELDSKVESGNGIDYSLLLDGLSAEREQKITIDVAYRYFNTEKRSFIVADTPGHEQYTRNMAVGAAFADLAVILVDANQGLLMQTKRHTRINAMMGIKHFVLAVNKMDLIAYDYERFKQIKEDFETMMSSFNIKSAQVIPLSATQGDNLVQTSLNTPWYGGPPLLQYLEEIDVDNGNSTNNNFILPVQRVSRPNHTFRGFQGLVESGEIKIGDKITALPSNEKAQIKKLYNADKLVKKVSTGNAVTIQLDREIDISRGSVLTNDRELNVSNLFLSNLLWMDDLELVEGRNYYLKIGTNTVPATIIKIKSKVDVNTGEKIATQKLYKNELAQVEISLSEAVVFDSFKRNEALGSFILIDRITHMTSAAGTIEHALRRSTNLKWQDLDITRKIRAQQKNQNPMTLWFTGLSGSGKSTIANALEKRLVSLGKHTMLLDGDNIRHGVSKNLGFKEVDRIENIRRIAEISRLMNDAGLIVLDSLISPYIKDRENAKSIIGENSFIEIYVDTPIEVCEERDVKGLYKKARKGEIPNFTGISSPYEVPPNADIIVNTETMDIAEIVDYILEQLLRKI